MMTAPITGKQFTAPQLESAKQRIADSEGSMRTVSVASRLSEYARLYTDRVAFEMVADGSKATYAEFEAQSNRIARALQDMGVRIGDRVAVMLSNRLVFPMIWLAIAKIGAVIVPVNMRYTAREIEYVISDSDAHYAIADAATLDTFYAMEPWPSSLPQEHVLVVGGEAVGKARTFESHVARYSTQEVSDPGVQPDTLMNIQYTSGTTGFPKGCMLTQDYWMVFQHQSLYWEKEPCRRYMTAQPLFYADPQWQMLRALHHGATFVIAPQLSGSRFMGWVRRHQVEWCQLPELVARQVAEIDDGDVRLRYVTAFGWSTETIAHFRRRFPNVPTRDAFAMTEIGFGTQMPYELEGIEDRASVGIRAPFREIRIVKDDGAEAQPGEVGELWVKGRSIFKGYWNKPEANAEAFVGEWFRTGDLFKSDDDGFCWLVGRVKEMIRRAGENIAAREVEAVIRELPDVEDVAAVPVKDVTRGEEVKIYVQLKKETMHDELPIARILDHTRARLAIFKQPRYIAFVASLPRTVTNKVLKRELIAGIDDLRKGAYDAQDQVWR